MDGCAPHAGQSLSGWGAQFMHTHALAATPLRDAMDMAAVKFVQALLAQPPGAQNAVGSAHAADTGQIMICTCRIEPARSQALCPTAKSSLQAPCPALPWHV